MKATRIAFASFAFAALLPLAASAERVQNMRVTLDVHADASIAVSEAITYDFGVEQRHGIFRDIPLQYKDELGGTEEIDIAHITVSDDSGQPYTFETSRQGGNLRIKIGDPDTLITGVHMYVITYDVYGAVGYFPDHDEVYWNATGNLWPVTIDAAQVAVWTPAMPTSSACYQGSQGSTESCSSKVSRLDGTGRPLTLFTNGSLEINQGLTVAVGLEKGVLTAPSTIQKWTRLIRHNLPLALPFVAFIILYSLWWKFGKDATGRGTIIPEYDVPAGISPPMIGLLTRERVDAKDLSAMIIQLAVRGFMTIERVETTTLVVFKSTDYAFNKLKDADDTLLPEERTLFDAMFQSGDRILSSELKSSGKLRSAFSTISSAVEKETVAKGYFRMRPKRIRATFFVAGAVFFVVSIFFIADSATAFSVGALILTLMMIFTFAWFMPAVTKKGALLREQILGLKDYLQIAEKNRLDFHHAPEKSPALFEKLLPAAMVLGVSTAWAKEFEGIYTTPPQWYVGNYAAFSPTTLTNELDTFSSAAAAIAAPTSGSGGAGGGGFSGGGFGGGGGGSW